MKLEGMIAECGPHGRPSRLSLTVLGFWVVIGLCVVVLGILAVIDDNRNVDGRIVGLVGLAVLLITALVYWWVAGAHYERVQVFPGGVSIRTKTIPIEYEWSAISRVSIATCYDTRFTSMKIVTLVFHGDAKPIVFTSRISGDVDRVIDEIRRRAPNVTTSEFSLG